MTNALVNEALRAGISALVAGVGWITEAGFWFRVLAFRWNQTLLARHYQLGPRAELERFNPELQGRLEKLYAEWERKGLLPQWVETSGSTKAPKRILYTRARVRERHWTFFESFARVLSRWGVFRRSFFVMASLAGADQGDRSLTSALLSGKKIPGRLICLQTPYRVQDPPEVRALAGRYGETALRLWLLAASQPGMLYATNPSTLAAFVDGLVSDWERARALCLDWVRDPEQFHPKVREAYQKIESLSSRRVLKWIAEQESISDPRAFFKKVLPKLQVISTWDGGYVAPYLEKVKASFEARFLPLYSMSTEVIETEPVVLLGGELGFLPISRGVVFEFIGEGWAEGSAEELKDANPLKPWELECGQEFVLVVSDPYGLKRYVTEDVFLCRRKVWGVPDLVFKRRQGLSYSFTGEKLTAEQVSLAIQEIRTSPRSAELWKSLGESVAPGFSVFPKSKPAPGYELIQIGGPILDPDSTHQLLQIFEAGLKAVNLEFAAKRESERLRQTTYQRLEPEAFARRVAPAKSAASWESQFKFLPLYPDAERSGQDYDKSGSCPL